MLTRRTFTCGALVTGAAAALPMTARSYAQVAGANGRVNFATAGLNGRGRAHLSAIGNNKPAAHLAMLCDVDSTVLGKACADASKELGYAPVGVSDFRKALESKDIDAISIATPDHWHAPMAIYALKAGKHVYLEKPSSHNPREGELLLAAQRKYGKLVQVGDQQRSSPHTIKMVGMIHAGLIGRAYYAKTWYSNNRKSMGIGKPVAVPSTLDWNLWQGPAPRTPYKDNIHPYNWHWLFRYGTGESLNNGTHEVDIARWCLDAGYPQRVSSNAGRYHFKDDWQFYDTMVTNFEYGDKLITWEGRCCNDMKTYGRGRGVMISGTAGSVILDREGYEVYDLEGKKTDEFVTREKPSTQDLISRDSMTDAHFRNFLGGIRTGEPLASPIAIANVSVTMVQLSNVAWRVNRELKIDTETGRVKDDTEAMKLWAREYEKGWEVTV